MGDVVKKGAMYHVFNMKLGSHDSCLDMTTAVELVTHFVDDGHKLSDISIIEGVELNKVVQLVGCVCTEEDTDA